MAQTRDLTKQDFEKALLLKVKENNVLKAQNARLIEHLQDQIDVTSTNMVQKESIHKKITQIGQLLSELTREEQDRKINSDRIFQKINDLENRIALNLNDERSATAEDVQELKIELVKIQSRENQIETHLQHLGTQITNTNQALTLLINKLLKPATNFAANANTANTATKSAGTTNPASTPLTEEEFQKIADELKTELKGTDEDLQLIYRLLT